LIPDFGWIDIDFSAGYTKSRKSISQQKLRMPLHWNEYSTIKDAFDKQPDLPTSSWHLTSRKW